MIEDIIGNNALVYNKILPIIEYFKAKYLSRYSDISDKLKQEWEDLIYSENGLVERLIPLQKEHNDVRNRENEFIDRLSLGVIFIEDGSVAFDKLAEDSLEPGKIVIYRQGRAAPIAAQPDAKLYTVYSDKLARIEKEIAEIRIAFQNNILDIKY